MANLMNSFDIKFADFQNLNAQLEEIGSEIAGTFGSLTHVLDKVADGSNPNLFHIMERQLRRGVVDLLGDAVGEVYPVGWQLERQIPTALRTAGVWCDAAELNAIKALREQVGEGGALATAPLASASFADEFYPAEIARREEEQRQKDEQDRKDAEGAAMVATIAQFFPELAAELQQEVDDARIEALIAYYEDPERGNNPELAAKIREQFEAMKKAREEAKKAAAEAGDLAGAFGSDGDSSSLGDFGLGEGASGVGALGDLGGSGLGGLGGLGGSDWGGSDLGSDWGGSDWASDLLDDNIDSSDFMDAASELGETLGGAASDAVSTGVDALTDAADLGVESGGVFGKYGTQVAAFASAYGMQVAAVAGGAAVLYATREQTTEAVAHVAEFVTTKCRPAVDDVMEQVRGAAKKTRVSLSDAKSSVKAAARGERAGDLIV